MKGLIGKTILLGSIPFLFYVVSSYFHVMNNLNNYNMISSVHGNLDKTLSSSLLIHNTQIERGLSATYLAGGVDASTLKKQHAKNDSKIIALKESLKNKGVDQEIVNDINKLLDKIPSLRQKVLNKEVNIPFVIKNYTAVVKKLLSLQDQIFNRVNFSSISAHLLNLRILEDAKEAGGKYRAVSSSILSKDQAITDQKLKSLFGLKYGLELRLSSPSLKGSQKFKESLSSILLSSQWEELNESFYIINKKKSEGNFGKDGEENFDNVTKVLNQVLSVMEKEKSSLEAAINSDMEKYRSALIKFSVTLVVLTLFLAFLIFQMIQHIRYSIGLLVRKMVNVTAEIEVESKGISDTAVKLSESSQRQASGIQETSAALQEIKQMVAKNADDASSAAVASRASHDSTLKGRESIQKLLKSLKTIEDSQSRASNNLETNSQNISEISSVINSIGEKTKIINDIVFQTKLLSFNASVEAARAGEHGKGFAVVAEEVGNLAAMSGTAANEISEILNSSIGKVNSLITETDRISKEMISEGEKNIEACSSVANDCNQALEEITKQVEEVDSAMKQIALATNEQSAGILQVNQAIIEMDNVTTETSVVAADSANRAKRANKFPILLNDVIRQFRILVQGSEERILTKTKKGAKPTAPKKEEDKETKPPMAA